ncbi:MAG: tetratricopeptide repeat protein [Calditrichaeota bacterium]|nr:tetratricopeptide repeat protein [Calditrichota bacterium]
MNHIIDFLSAEVPGGIYLLIFVLLVLNLVFLYLKGSDLMSPKQWKINLITANVVTLLFYIALWFILQPPKPQERVVALPSKIGDKFKIEAKAFRFAEAFENAAVNNTADRYLFHRWEWLYETLGRKKVNNYQNWLDAAKAMGSRFIVESAFKGDVFVCTLIDVQKGKRFEFKSADTLNFNTVLNAIGDKLDLFVDSPVRTKAVDDVILTARLAYLNKEYDRALEIVRDREDVPALILKGAAYVEKGLARPIDFERAKYVKTKNPDFDMAKKILIPLVKKRQDTPEVYILLGRMSIREKEYTDAELFLKKAYVEDPENCRVHFALSFLLPARLKDIGFKDRVAVLERAVYLDPGYRDAVYQLANEMYLAGTGTLGATRRAIKRVEEFLKIQPGDPEMKSLLGSLYVKTQHPDKALPIFEELNKEFPDDSDTYYNLGLCYYLKKQDSTALKLFMKAIKMDQHLDSYLYVAAIYRRMGKLDSALKYFRERVARKTGDDDKYAYEAMAGIQKVLILMEKQKNASKSDSSFNKKTN